MTTGSEYLAMMDAIAPGLVVGGSGELAKPARDARTIARARDGQVKAGLAMDDNDPPVRSAATTRTPPSS